MKHSGWLTCKSIENGMFSDELVVVVTRQNGVEDTYFVPAEEVQRESRRVRVQIRETDKFAWVTLPTEEQTTIPVDTKLIMR